MNRENLIQIAKETMQITNRGFYKINDKKIDLIHSKDKDFESVVVYTPEKLKMMMDEKENILKNSKQNRKKCKFYLLDADSFEVAKGFEDALVMNFASPTRAGGGFLTGARAQEEALCRASTLYNSISTKKASEMYDYNKKIHSPIDSDYMLLSKDVCVFRDKQGKLLEKPYNVGVFTIPAPNKNGRAKDIKQEELDYVMKDRIRKFFITAIDNKYKTLVLGAWGCGVFGHEPQKVAQYFYDIFFEEEYENYFENVIFAILYGKDKIQDFSKIFKEKIENFDDIDNI